MTDYYETKNFHPTTQEGYIYMLKRELALEKRIRLRNRIMRIIDKILRINK